MTKHAGTAPAARTAMAVLLLTLTVQSTAQQSPPPMDVSAMAESLRKSVMRPQHSAAARTVLGAKAANDALFPDTVSAARRSVARRGTREIVPDGRRIIFGTSYEDLAPMTEEQAFALKSIGFDVARPTAFGSKINPKRGVYDWAALDQTIDNLRAARFEIVMSVAWLPAWMSGGKPTYELYTDGCTRFKPGATSVMQIEFNDALDYCIAPPHIYDPFDPHPPDQRSTREHNEKFPFHSPTYQLGVELSKRYGSRVMAWAIGNEYKLDIYWPPSRLPDGSGGRRYIVEFVAPMTQGIRTVDLKAQFVGPEADSGGANEEALALERELGLNLYDAHSIHPYPWAEDWTNVFRRIREEFEPAIATNRAGRAIWYSECGGMPDVIAFVREVLESGRDVAMISVGDFRQWFVSGTWEKNAPVLNERGLEMKRLIEGHVKGRPMRRNV